MILGWLVRVIKFVRSQYRFDQILVHTPSSKLLNEAMPAFYYTWAGLPKSTYYPKSRSAKSLTHGGEWNAPSRSTCISNGIPMFAVPLSSPATTCVRPPSVRKYPPSDAFLQSGPSCFSRLLVLAMECVAYPVGLCLCCCDMISGRLDTEY